MASWDSFSVSQKLLFFRYRFFFKLKKRSQALSLIPVDLKVVGFSATPCFRSRMGKPVFSSLNVFQIEVGCLFKFGAKCLWFISVCLISMSVFVLWMFWLNTVTCFCWGQTDLLRVLLLLHTCLTPELWLCPEWHPIPYVVRYFWPGSISQMEPYSLCSALLLTRAHIPNGTLFPM